MKIRPATDFDVPQIMNLERQCPSAAHWSEQQYQHLLQSEERLILVMEAASSSPSNEGKQIVGFLVAHHVASEWELENIVVTPTSRRSGFGSRLLEELLTAACGTNSSAVILEVRESNVAARALYEKAGFALSGRRKAYYSNPPEDAVLYRKSLP